MYYALAIAAALVLSFVIIYNGLVKLRVQTKGAWADIDVQLKRRYDLIPSLVETVKGYAAHETDTFNAVVEARNRAMSVQGPARKGEAEGMLAEALKSLFALAEAYPQLRAVASFTQPQASLNEIEAAVQDSRRCYNAVVRDLNTRIQQIPHNLVAGMVGFTEQEFFEIPSTGREAPRADFRTEAEQ